MKHRALIVPAAVMLAALSLSTVVAQSPKARSTNCDWCRDPTHTRRSSRHAGLLDQRHRDAARASSGVRRESRHFRRGGRRIRQEADGSVPRPAEGRHPLRRCDLAGRELRQADDAADVARDRPEQRPPSAADARGAGAFGGAREARRCRRTVRQRTDAARLPNAASRGATSVRR